MNRFLKEKDCDDMPLVSVVMPVYNGERFLKESIDSILLQSYKKFELIIWNDGSSDRTSDIVATYTDKRIRYFYHTNTGLGEALAMACEKVRGKYIARIDCDDICMPNRLEKQVLFLENHPDYCLASSSVLYIDENGTILGRSFPWTWNVNVKKRDNIVHPATMFRHEAYIKTGGYLKLKLLEDKTLWARMSRFGKITNLKAPLIKYRILSNSMSHAINPNSKYFNQYLKMRGKLLSTEIPSESDIKAFNDIFIMVRNDTPNREMFAIKTSPLETVYKTLKILCGCKLSEQFVFLFSNIYAYLRFL